MRNHLSPWFRSLPHFATWDEHQRRYWTDPKLTRHYNKAGEPISLLEWSLLFEDNPELSKVKP
jgi:hypothetical protein